MVNLSSDPNLPYWHERLRKALVDHFNEEEIEVLCFDLVIDYRNLAGQTYAKKVIELIRYVVRVGRLDELINYCSRTRPNVAWHEMNPATEAETKPALEAKKLEDLASMEPASSGFEVLSQVGSAEKQNDNPIDGKVQFNETQKKLLEELKPIFENADRRQFTFLTIGRTGVGKSSTINSLLGAAFAKVGKYTVTTTEVGRYYGEIHGIRFSIVDTPGLGDRDPKKRNDEKYLHTIKEEVPHLDSMWFMTRIDETRVRSDEIRTIRLISKIFTPKIWERGIIIFTFSDKVDSDDFPHDLEIRTKLIRDEISNSTGPLIANQVPVVAVANDKRTGKPLHLPNGSVWLGELYTVVFTRISQKGAAPFFLATYARVNDEQGIVLTPEQQNRINARIEADSTLSKIKKFIDEAATGKGFVADIASVVKGLWDWFSGK